MFAVARRCTHGKYLLQGHAASQLVAYDFSLPIDTAKRGYDLEVYSVRDCGGSQLAPCICGSRNQLVLFSSISNLHHNKVFRLRLERQCASCDQIERNL